MFTSSFKGMHNSGRIFFFAVACRGGADGETAPGIHPEGHPSGKFSLKDIGK